MGKRPYRRMKVDELDRLFSSALHDETLARAILGELGFRSTSKALDLKQRIEAHLKNGRPAAEPAKSPRAQSPSPAPPQLAQPSPVPKKSAPPSHAEKAAAPAEVRDTAEAKVAAPAADRKESPSRPSAAVKPALTPAQAGVAQLIDYVRKLIEHADKPIWSLASYQNVVLHEENLRNRIGIRHDLTDADGPVYLKIDRLRRIDPPEPSLAAKDWLTISKDPFKEPVIQSLRTVVLPGADAERLVAEGKVDPSDVTRSLKPKPGEDLRDAVLRLDRFSDAKAEVDAYINRTWSQWSQAERPRRETIDIYDRLFSLQQALKLEGSDKPLEVVWGMGVARWKLPPHELDHPLVEQLAELELDEAGAILVRPRGVDPIFALKPFEAMKNNGTDLVVRFAREHFSKLAPERELSPFEKETYTPILRYACARFDKAGRYHPDSAPVDDRKVPPAGPTLVVTDTWALYARPRSENFLTADLQRLREAVEEAGSLPGPSVSLVNPPSNEAIYVPSIAGLAGIMGGPSVASAPASIAETETAQGESNKFFFPKPFNAEQIAIVERLESDGVEGVVVQGPPGTGKTHTIANIICHYLAKGRRVLVTSKSEGALAVLRDQIPEGIRDLAISLLTSEREGLKQLETTVNLLASKIVSLDPRPVERDIADGERRIAELERRITGIDGEVRAFAEKHLRRVGAGKDTDGLFPIELAERIVRERARYTWLSDRPDPAQGGNPQFTDQDVAAMRTARKTLATDLAYLDVKLPSVSDFPDVAELAAIHQDLANAVLIERNRRENAPLMSSSEKDALARAEALLASVEALAAVHESCQSAPWLGNLYIAWRRHGLDAEPVRIIAQLIASISAPVTKRTMIASYAVVTAEEAHADTELVAAVSRAADGQRPFGLMPFGKSAQRSTFDGIRILDRKPGPPEEWKRVAEVLSWKAEMAAVRAQWRALAPEYALPAVPDQLHETARVFETMLGQVNAVAESVRRHLPLVLAEVGPLFPSGLDATNIVSSLDHARAAVEAIRSEVSRHRLNGARTRLSGALKKARQCSGNISQRIVTFLSETVGNPDLAPNRVADDWSTILTELERVRALRSQLDTVSRVATQVSASGAPAWADHLRRTPVDGVEDPWTPMDWHDAWLWAQAETHLRAIDGRARLRELDEQRRKADDEMRGLFHDVVRMRTLLTLKARITRRVDANLQMFLTAIRKIGKGTGKSASRLRRDARDAMEASYAAVPCWIMPSWRISESLPSTLGSFDLVIFDEASQSDISALPALLRASKVLIVGDDKQVSPTAAFIEEQKLRSLRLHYLDGQPFGALMLPGNSLYELALACYPGRRIMLREHFRCVESIIRFSFQFYPEEIVPVRLSKASERLSPPLIDVHVLHGRKDRSNRNFAEAEAIVDEVARIVADPKMVRRSIGIISLIGAKQAQLIQARLLERIGEEAYVRHDIACGDSAVFQGKERDIVLLSMVECPETRTSKTALPFQQRFNVALSRARDREYLFRSVTEEMLKPDDLKAKVLRHFKNPMEGRTAQTSDLIALCQSGFERDVLSRLLKVGYRVHPQVGVGPYSIDLVVEGNDDRRLAVELDGDKYHGPERWAEDLARQRVMERVGWQFWRCWGSSFRLDPDSCMDDLIGSLEALDIKPIGFDQPANVWTEFRTVRPHDADESDLNAGSPDATSVASAGIPPTAPELPAEGDATGVEIGDRVQVQANDDSRVRVITLTANKHDPDLGAISVQHPSGAALLGAEEDEEIEFEVDGKSHRWMVVHIEKARPLVPAALIEPEALAVHLEDVD